MDMQATRTCSPLILAAALLGSIGTACYTLQVSAAPIEAETSRPWINLDTQGLGFSDFAMTSKLCKATVSLMMGRPTSIMSDSGQNLEDGVFTVKIAYLRDDDTQWTYHCKVSGNDIVWKSEVGRWRTHSNDEKYRYTLNGEMAHVVETSGLSGSERSKDFDLSSICVNSQWPTCAAQGME